MKKIIILLASAVAILGLGGCNEMFEKIEPLDKIKDKDLVQSQAGLNTLLANVYYNIPIEDFNYRFNAGFNRRGWGGGVSELSPSEFFTDNAGRSSGTAMGPSSGAAYWPYTEIRSLNMFFESIEQSLADGYIDQTVYDRMIGDAHFARAYMYFGLVKRKGGVPLITETLDKYYDGGESSGLYVARSTEEECYDFIIEECEKAAATLPSSLSASEQYRASKWAALALKSRVALHAASLAKFWDRAPLSSGSEAVANHLVGFANTSTAAEKYYKACIDACEELIRDGGFSLYMPDPASAEEAADNYQQLFQTTSTSEFIFGKAYAGETLGSSHSYDCYYSPHQAATGYHKDTRYSIMLDLVDTYENLDSNGASAPIVTRTDGVETEYVANPVNLDTSIPFKTYDDPTEPFANKDPRFKATILYNGSSFRNVTILMQAGVIDPSGVPHVYTNDAVTGKDGETYYAFGTESGVAASGFFGMDNSDNTNYGTTGFLLKKFLVPGSAPESKENGSSTTPFIDFRLAEIYLNYAEAVVENTSGYGNKASAAKYLNDIRHRAFLKGDVALTRENVRKERRVELALEGHRMWDLVRWREFHGNNMRRHALLPVLDLRGDSPKYVFVRANWKYDEDGNGQTIQPTSYYQGIPNTGTNGLIPNTF